MKLISQKELNKVKALFGEDYKKKMNQSELEQYVYSRGFYDFRFFFDYHLLHLKIDPETGVETPSPEFHNELYSEMEIGWLVAIISRGHAKTTIGWTRWLHKICYAEHFNRHNFLLYSSGDMNKKILFKIKDEFEKNESIRAIFGELVPRASKIEKLKVWTQTKIQFLNDCLIQSVSKAGAIRGERPDEIWIDDPQESKDILNEEQAMKHYNHLKTAIIPTLKPGGILNVTGTNLGKMSMVNLLSKDVGNNFRKIEYPAVQGIEIKETPIKKNGVLLGKRLEIIGGKILWEKRYTLEHLNNFLQNMGYEAFMQEFQNVAYTVNHRPVFDKGLIFNIVKPTYVTETGWKYFGKLKDGEPISQFGLAIAFDLAEGLVGGDYSTCIARDRQGKLVWEYRGHIEQKEFAEEFYREIWSNGFHGLLIPEKNAGLAFIDAIKSFRVMKKSLYLQRNTEKKGRGERTKTYGFTTSQKTKTEMIENFAFHLKYASEMIKGNKWTTEQRAYEVDISERCHTELLTFYRDEKGRCAATSGNHDDVIMADMICLLNIGNIRVIDPNMKINV